MKKLIVLSAVVIVASLIAVNARAATLITDWTFEASAPVGSGSVLTGLLAETGTGTATGSHSSASTVWSTPVGNGSTRSFSSNNWNVGDYYEFKTSTLGFSTISLSWDQTSSSTGPRDFILQYSLDGSNFTTSGAQYTVQINAAPNDVWTAGSRNAVYAFTRSSVSAALDNQSVVWFRLVDNSTTSASGGTVATTGTDRVDNFKVLGIAPLANPTYWNGNLSGGGSGTWNTVNTSWNTAANGSGTASAFDSSKAAVFGTTGGTVTVSGNGGVTADGGMQFNVDGYTITGTTITLGTTSTIVVANSTDTATINAPMAGSSGLTVSGSGTVVLGTTNTFQGAISVAGASLSVSRDNNLGDVNNSLTLSSGTFKVTDNTSMPSTRALTLDGSGTIDVAATKTLTVAGGTDGGDLSLSNTGTVVLAGTSKNLGNVLFNAGGTLKFNDGTGTALVAGNIQNSSAATATVNGNLNFGATLRSITATNANGTMIVTGGITNAGRVNLTGPGTIDLQGDNSGLTNANPVQIGNQNFAGPKVIVHDPNSLGTSGEIFFNSGTIYAATPIVFGSALSQSLGSASSAGNQFTNKYDGANMTFQGVVHLFNGNTLDQRITVNNTTTFAGGWSASTGTTVSPSVVINGSTAGRLVLAGTLDIDKPLAIQTATVDVNGTMSNPAATFLITNTGRVRNGVDNALPTAGSVTVGTTGLSTTVAASTGTYSLNGHNQTIGTVHLFGGAISGAGTLTSGSNYDVRDGSVSANLAGSVGLVKSTGVFTDVVTLSGNNSYTGGTTVDGGTLVVGHVHGLGNSKLTINNSAITQLQAGLTGPVQLDLLSIAGGATPTAKLDITDNNMIVHNGNISALRAQARYAFGNAWDSPGLTSSTAADDAQNGPGDKAVAVFLNDNGDGDPFYTSWPSGADSGGAVSVTTTDVLIKYTFFGDADGDGHVDGAVDYSLWYTGFTDNSFSGWLFGDFDYDGETNGTVDYSLWYTGFTTPDGPLGAGGVQPVPEPGTLLLAAMGLAGVAAFARRRRRVA